MLVYDLTISAVVIKIVEVLRYMFKNCGPIQPHPFTDTYPKVHSLFYGVALYNILSGNFHCKPVQMR